MPSPSIRAFVRNLRRSRLSARAAAWLLVSNNVTKLRRLSGCCGNPGQPGC